MRGRKARKKKTFPFIFLIFVIFAFFGVGYSLLSAQLTIEGKATIHKKSSDPSLPDGKDFDVTFHNQGGSISDKYNYAVTIKNITTTAATGWVIYILVPDDTKISSSWGCTAVVENGMLIITDAGWNGSISAGSSQGYAAGFAFTTSDSSVLPFKYTALKR